MIFSDEGLIMYCTFAPEKLRRMKDAIKEMLKMNKYVFLSNITQEILISIDIIVFNKATIRCEILRNLIFDN